MSLETEPQQLNRWQLRAEATHRIDTPANRLDAVAGVAAIIAAPHLDTEWGIGVAMAAYGADAVDGTLARVTGTASELGAKIDTVGDKIKIFYAIYHIWKNKQAPRPLLAAVAAQNLANAAITLADQAVNVSPQVEVTGAGKAAMGMQAGGIGMNVIGKKIAETNRGRGIDWQVEGTLIAIAGLVKFGLPTTRDYWRKFSEGERKPWVNKISSDLGRNASHKRQ